MRYLAWVVLFALCSVGVSAQDTRGNISGTVTDPQGGILPARRDRHQHRHGNINPADDQRQRLLRSAAAAARRLQRHRGNGRLQEDRCAPGMTLAIGEQLQIDMQLEVGGTTESVTVTAEAPMLDTSSGHAPGGR